MKKIIYFDEGSAADLLDIKNEGSLFLKLVKDNDSNVDGRAKIGAKTAIALKSIFFKTGASAEAELSTSFRDNEYISQTITNSILFDTLDYLQNNEEIGKKIKDYKIEFLNNSIAYLQSIAPYLGMIKSDGIKIDENTDIDITKIHDTLKNSKGYYEVIAKKGKSKIILRFNNEAFRNNYGLFDLQKMKLCFYGIEVGKMEEKDLDFNNIMPKENLPINSFDEIDITKSSNNSGIKVYDVLLAGVE